MTLRSLTASKTYRSNVLLDIHHIYRLSFSSFLISIAANYFKFLLFKIVYVYPIYTLKLMAFGTPAVVITHVPLGASQVLPDYKIRIYKDTIKTAGT